MLRPSCCGSSPYRQVGPNSSICVWLDISILLVVNTEVSDVCNAVYDGADAVMTSGETAKGRYPDGTIQMMNEIILSAENFSISGSLGSLYTQHFGEKKGLFVGGDDVLTSAAKGAVEASLTRKASGIIVIDDDTSGRLTSLVASYRPTCPRTTRRP